MTRLVLFLALARILFSGGVMTAPPLLVPGHKVWGHLGPGGANEYLLNVAAGECARIIVDQQSVDVAVSVISRTRTLTDIDAFESAPESVSLLADSGGTFRIVIRGATRASHGRYSILLAS